MKLWEDSYREAAVQKLLAGEKTIMGLKASAGSINVDEATMVMTISTKTKDRSGDVMESKGVKLANYRANPVVLAFHDHRKPPVAKTLEISVGDDSIEALAKFALGINPEADLLFSLYRDDFMKASSVGFMPEEYEKVLVEGQDGRLAWRGGLHHTIWELMEWSLVPVPDNPESTRKMVQSILWVAKEAGMEIPDLGHTPSAEVIKVAQLVDRHPELLEEDGLAGLVKTMAMKAISEAGVIPQINGEDQDDPAFQLAVEDLAEEVKALAASVLK